MVSVNNFSYGLLTPALCYVVAGVGLFLGLRCVTLGRAYHGLARAPWLCLAAVSIGATGFWATHFIAMLGVSIPTQQIRYNVPLTLGSMLVAVAVASIGLFIVGYGEGGVARLIAAGLIVGAGVAAMHEMGTAAMSIPDSMSHSTPLFALSVLIAIVLCTATIWAATRVRGLAATIGASLILAVAISGLHYTGMAAMSLHSGSMPSMAVAAASGISATSGATAASFLIPVLLLIGSITFLTTLTIGLSPSAGEIAANAEMERRLSYLQHRHASVHALSSAGARPAAFLTPRAGTGALPRRSR